MAKCYSRWAGLCKTKGLRAPARPDLGNPGVTWLVVSRAIWDDDSELTIFSRWLNHFNILQCTTTMRNKMLEAFYTTNQSLVEIFIMLHRPTSSKEQSTSRSITPRGPGRGGTDPAGYPSKKDKKGNTWEEWWYKDWLRLISGKINPSDGNWWNRVLKDFETPKTPNFFVWAKVLAAPSLHLASLWW